MSDAVAGHGALISYQPTPGGAFEVIGELNGDIQWPEMSRGESEVTPHQDDIDSWVLGVLRRGPLTFGVNFIFDDPTHDSSTGIMALIKDNTTTGWKLVGPSGDADDTWIGSGQVQSINKTAPVRDGAYTAEVTVRMSGPMLVAGVVWGSVAP